MEHIGYQDSATRDVMIDLARRYGRDKHLQSVVIAVHADLFGKPEDLAALQESLKVQGAEELPGLYYEFTTTKRGR